MASRKRGTRRMTIAQAIRRVDWEIALWSSASLVSLMVMAVALPLFQATFVAEDGQGRAQYFSVLVVGMLAASYFYPVMMMDTKKVTQEMTEYMNSRTVWKVAVLGLTQALEILFLAFASLAARVPGAIQPMFLQTILLWNVVLSKVLLGKRYQRMQIMGLLLISIGILISLVPTAQGIASGQSKLSHGLHWPFLFILGCVFSSLTNVVTEWIFDDLPHMDLNYLLARAAAFQVLSLLCLFWLEILPGFGTARTMHEFGQDFHFGVTCFFTPHRSRDPGRCFASAPLGLLFLMGYLGMYVFGGRVMRFASANYFTTIQTLANCVTPFFWIAFPRINSWAGGEAYDRWDLIASSVAIVPVLFGMVVFRRFERNTGRHSSILAAAAEQVRRRRNMANGKGFRRRTIIRSPSGDRGARTALRSESKEVGGEGGERANDDGNAAISVEASTAVRWAGERTMGEDGPLAQEQKQPLLGSDKQRPSGGRG